MELILAVTVAVLMAVLVGAAVPALLQLRRTLRTAETFLETTAGHLHRALDEASEAGAKVRLAAGRVEGGAAELQKLLGAADSVADLLGELRESLRGILGVAATIVPAISGAIHHAVAGRATAGHGERPEGAASEQDAHRRGRSTQRVTRTAVDFRSGKDTSASEAFRSPDHLDQHSTWNAAKERSWGSH